MKVAFSFLFLLLVWTPVITAQEAEIKELLPEKFWDQYQAEVFAIIVDTQTEEEYKTIRIPGSVNLPEMKNLIAFSDTLDREIPLYLYCQIGSRAIAAAEYLISKEFLHVYTLKGGLTEWIGLGLPVKKD